MVARIHNGCPYSHQNPIFAKIIQLELYGPFMVEPPTDFERMMKQKLREVTSESRLSSGINRIIGILEQEILQSIEDSSVCLLGQRDRPSINEYNENDYVIGQDWSPLQLKIVDELWAEIKRRLPVSAPIGAEHHDGLLRRGNADTFFEEGDDYYDYVDDNYITVKKDLLSGLNPIMTCIMITLGQHPSYDAVDRVETVEVCGEFLNLVLLKVPSRDYGEAMYSLNLTEDFAKYRFQVIEFEKYLQ